MYSLKLMYTALRIRVFVRKASFERVNILSICHVLPGITFIKLPLQGKPLLIFCLLHKVYNLILIEAPHHYAVHLERLILAGTSHYLRANLTTL